MGISEEKHAAYFDGEMWKVDQPSYCNLTTPLPKDVLWSLLTFFRYRLFNIFHENPLLVQMEMDQSKVSSWHGIFYTRSNTLFQLKKKRAPTALTIKCSVCGAAAPDHVHFGGIAWEHSENLVIMPLWGSKSMHSKCNVTTELGIPITDVLAQKLTKLKYFTEYFE